MTSFRSVSAAAQDTRRVQTAVVGPTAASKKAFYLPTDRDQAKVEYDPDSHYWCGTHQGGCGRQLSARFPLDKVAHFFHRGAKAADCPLSERRRGWRDFDPLAAWSALSPWRQARGLAEGHMNLFDNVRGCDARFMHISSPGDPRDTRIVLGDATDDRVLQDAKAPRAREWDWFVHQDNSLVRMLLDKYGVSYGLIRFADHGNAAPTMEVFLRAGANEEGWGSAERYVPAPNRPLHPVEAPVAVGRVPAQAQTVVQERPEPAPVVPRERAASLESDLRVQRPPVRRRATTPTRPRPSTPKPAFRKAQESRTEERLSGKLQSSALLLDEALNRGDRRDIKRYARNLQNLRDEHEGRLALVDEQWIKHLLSQAGTKR
ncbi:hypothetical protein ACFWTE_11675 [Nocardiopsis sp. NPDC058631]|uniref:hypothetical protein n=1 Tax=Nocardiopsis sp. NPDC058631 TaxID=3346566 RepID=UPI00364BECD6